jgi:hypothetical protein
VAASGSLEVVAGIAWANLQAPAAISIAPGQASPPVYGRAVIEGETLEPGLTPELIAELGYGADGTDPSAAPEAWQWSAAAFHQDVEGSDEFVGTLTVSAPGLYDYCYRFAYRDSPWIYADLDGSTNGYAPAQAGALTVAESAAFDDATPASLYADTGPSRGVAWGDYDDDGDLDLYVSERGVANKLFRNDGGGILVEVDAGLLADTGNCRGAFWFDHDNDGDLDLFVTNAGTPSRLFHNEGPAAWSFSDVTSGPLLNIVNVSAAAWGDYDSDGDLDLYLAGWGEANKLLRNDGGSFTDVTYGALASVWVAGAAAWCDYDNDGDLDLFVGNQSSTHKLFRNEAGGYFTDATSGPLAAWGSIEAAAWGDYDNDGAVDLYIVRYQQSNTLLRNSGPPAWSFTDATTGPLAGGGPSRDAAWGDYDNDGDIDLCLVEVGGVKLLRNGGGGVFVNEAGFPFGAIASSQSAAWADYDGDGDLDLCVAYDALPNRLLRNVIGSSRDWLHVDLVGTASNRSGIGARIRAVAGALRQEREVPCGDGGRSQSSSTAEFGLGVGAVMDSLIVRWPSGRLQDVIPPPAVNAAVVITESAPLVDCDPEDCDSAADLGVINGDIGSEVLASSGIGAGWLHMLVQEGDTGSSCSPLSATVRLAPPAGSDYDLLVYWDDCATLAGRSAHAGPNAEEVRLWWNEECDSGVPTSLDDSRFVYVKVVCRSVSDQDQWSLQVTGNTGPTTAVGEERSAASVLLLHQNAPNPFNPSTTIRFELPESGHVRLGVFGADGRLVRDLVNGVLQAGRHAAVWDGRDGAGCMQASGAYFCRLTTTAGRRTIKVSLLR